MYFYLIYIDNEAIRKSVKKDHARVCEKSNLMLSIYAIFLQYCYRHNLQRILEMFYLVIAGISKLSLMTMKEKFVRITIKLACDQHVDNLQEFQKTPITINFPKNKTASRLLK